MDIHVKKTRLMDKEKQVVPGEGPDKVIAAASSAGAELPQAAGLPYSREFRVMLLLFSLLTYMILFNILFFKSGHGMTITVIIPVVVSGWLFGLVPGICAGVLTVPLNLFMALIVGVSWWDQAFGGGAGIVGTVGCILVGTVVGWIRDLTLKINTELSDRKRAEAQIKQQHDELEETHKKLKQHTSNENWLLKRCGKPKNIWRTSLKLPWTRFL